MLDPKLLPILKELYPLRNLGDEEIAQIAEAATFASLAKSETIKLMGGPDAPFYLLLNGRLEYIELRGEESRGKPVTIRPGGFFGADNLLFEINRDLEVAASEPSQLITIPSARLAGLLNKIPGLKVGLQEGLELHHLLQNKAFAWVQDSEQVKLLAIKHPAVLVEFLFWPILWLLGGIALLGLGSQMAVASLRIAFVSIGILVTAYGFGWCIWQFIDWRNDFYIVTDQRVVWVEKVLWLYESRREALLSAIKSTEVKTSQVGRIMGYGSITVFALMGQVKIADVANPDQIKVLIDRMQKLASIRVQQDDTKTMEKIIRRKIDPPPLKPPSAAAGKAAPAKQGLIKLPHLGEVFSAEERIARNETITYRKHRIILVLKIALPVILLTGLVGGAAWIIYQNMAGQMSFPSIGTTILTALFLASGLIFWLWYQYMDWYGDIYEITPDKIIDSIKKPLGTEVTKSAPLGSIQNMDYERIGFIGLILNLGNVTINTGSESKMVFRQVHDPARAQMDIFNQLFALKRKQQTAESSRQWEQVAEWLAAYHRQAEELRNLRK